MIYIIFFLRESRPSSARAPLRVDRGYISRLGKRVVVDNVLDKRTGVDNVHDKRVVVDNLQDKRAGVDDIDKENIQGHFEDHKAKNLSLRAGDSGGVNITIRNNNQPTDRPSDRSTTRNLVIDRGCWTCRITYIQLLTQTPPPCLLNVRRSKKNHND